MLLAEAAPGLTAELAAARLDGPVPGFPGVPSYLRAANGPGWALSGTRFKDPIPRTASPTPCATPNCSRAPSCAATLRDYERARDALPLLALTDRIVGYQWDLAELRDLLGELSKAMRPEAGALLALDEPAATAA